MNSYREPFVLRLLITFLYILSFVPNLVAQSKSYSKEIKFSTDQGTWISLDISPDNQTIIFELLGDIFSLPIDGGRADLLLGGSSFFSQPRYSPDGKSIIYISDKSGSDQLWLMSDQGGNIKQISSIVTDGMFSPEWALDGKSIYLSTIQGAYNRKTSIVQIDLETGERNLIVENKKIAGSRLVSTPASGPFMSSIKKSDNSILYTFVTPRAYGSRDGAKSKIISFNPNSRKGIPLAVEKSNPMKPTFSPDEKWLVYAAESKGQTGLRVLEVSSGMERWLAFPFQRNELEARATRDLIPNYAISNDSKFLISVFKGEIHKINFQTLSKEIIPFSADVSKQVVKPLSFSHRIQDKPFVARFINQPAISSKAEVVVSVHTNLYKTSLKNFNIKIIPNTKLQRSFYPSWSPDGDQIVYCTWEEGGGNIWLRKNKSETRQITKINGFYAQPVINQENKRILAIRSSVGVKRKTKYSVIPPEADFIEVDLQNKNLKILRQTGGYQNPQFNPNGNGFFASSSQKGLAFFAAKSEPRVLVKLSQPVKYIKVNRAINSLLVTSNSGDLYRLDLPKNLLEQDTILELNPSKDGKLLTDKRPEEFGWSSDGIPFWTLGNQLFLGSNEKSFDLSISFQKHKPKGILVLRGAKVITMKNNELIESADIVIQDNRIIDIGPKGQVVIPKVAQVIDVSNKVVIPGLIDIHAHAILAQDAIEPISPFTYSNLAYGITALRDPQATPQIFTYSELVEKGEVLGPRIYSTGPGIFAFDQLNSYEKIKERLKIYSDRYQTHLIKSYLVGNRKQRQWIVQACRELELMPTTEGGADTKLDLTHALDGFSGNEHAIPNAPIYKDISEFFAQSGIAYTPTLLVAFGGPLPVFRFFAEQNPFENEKLKYFFPNDVLYQKTANRLLYFRKEDYHVKSVSAGANDILLKGGLVTLGGHGELQGIQNHWEMWLLASGGMSNHNVLKVATINSAKAIGLDQDLGSLEKGKLADLVILSKDPLDNIKNTTAIEFVMKNGVLYNGSTLNQIWPTKIPATKPWWQYSK